MDRWRRLLENVGRWAAIRTALTALVFTFIAIGAAAAEASPWPPVVWAAGIAAPMPLRRRFIAHLERTARSLRFVGLFIVAAAAAFGAARGQLWAEGHPLEWTLFLALTGLVAGYVSAFFWTFSDPAVVRLE